jgi:hypothetical protein
MSILSDYSAEEQQLLLRSLSAAALAIAAASLGKRRETASEGIAAATYILESREEFLGNTLVGSVQHELEIRAEQGAAFPNFEEQAVAEGAATTALATLRDVATLLDTKSTQDEASGYKQWLLSIAKNTALGGTEGGNWLGRGAVQVNEAEKEALKKVNDALGLAAK